MTPQEYHFPSSLVISGYPIASYTDFIFPSRLRKRLFEASNKLNNCLRFFLDRSDMADNNPVICVSKGEKLVAAIEVHGKSIVQASGYSNRPLEYDPYLYKAYTRWCKKYNLHEGRQ